MSKMPYFPPRLGQYQPAFFPAPIWDAGEADASFQSLRPFYLVCRTQQFSVSAVRFRIVGEEEYRDWQAVSLVADDDSFLPDTKAHTWLLLGFVPAGVRFDLELRCRDEQGRIGIAARHNLVALESRSFELAQI